MSNETQNLSKLLCFIDVLCDFAEDVSGYEYHDHEFNVELDDNKFNFDLPELVAEIRKSRQAVINDIENCSDDEWGDEEVYMPNSFLDELFPLEFTTEKTSNDEVADKPKSFFDELFVLEPTTEKTSNDEVADKPKSFFDELFVPEFTTEKMI